MFSGRRAGPTASECRPRTIPSRARERRMQDLASVRRNVVRRRNCSSNVSMDAIGWCRGERILRSVDILGKNLCVRAYSVSTRNERSPSNGKSIKVVVEKLEEGYKCQSASLVEIPCKRNDRKIRGRHKSVSSPVGFLGRMMIRIVSVPSICGDCSSSSFSVGFLLYHEEESRKGRAADDPSKPAQTRTKTDIENTLLLEYSQVIFFLP